MALRHLCAPSWAGDEGLGRTAGMTGCASPGAGCPPRELRVGWSPGAGSSPREFRASWSPGAGSSPRGFRVGWRGAPGSESIALAAVAQIGSSSSGGTAESVELRETAASATSLLGLNGRGKDPRAEATLIDCGAVASVRLLKASSSTGGLLVEALKMAGAPELRPGPIGLTAEISDASAKRGSVSISSPAPALLGTYSSWACRVSDLSGNVRSPIVATCWGALAPGGWHATLGS